MDTNCNINCPQLKTQNIAKGNQCAVQRRVTEDIDSCGYSWFLRSILRLLGGLILTVCRAHASPGDDGGDEVNPKSREIFPFCVWRATVDSVDSTTELLLPQVQADKLDRNYD